MKQCYHFNLLYHLPRLMDAQSLLKLVIQNASTAFHTRIEWCQCQWILIPQKKTRSFTRGISIMIKICHTLVDGSCDTMCNNSNTSAKQWSHALLNVIWIYLIHKCCHRQLPFHPVTRLVPNMHYHHHIIPSKKAKNNKLIPFLVSYPISLLLMHENFITHTHICIHPSSHIPHVFASDSLIVYIRRILKRMKKKMYISAYSKQNNWHVKMLMYKRAVMGNWERL